MYSPPITGKTRAIVAPGALDAYVQKQQPKPCIVILIHGVNDLAGAYDDLETGICTGLNERLDHLLTKRGERSPATLNPARYTSPQDDDGKAPNPDAVYYRRRPTAGKHGGRSRSVVIPFYWGFREEEGRIQKQTPHGEWLDRFGNRLDKSGTKEGGPFANATTTLPDMFGQGFSGNVAGIPVNLMFGTPDHPLFPALSALGGRFFQRVFTTRERDGKGEEVGLPPSYAYTLLGQGRSREGERTWEGTELGSGRATVANASFSIGQTVTIHAPALPVPFLPDFVAGGTTLDRQGSRGIKPVWTPTDPIDASISITNGGIDVHTTRVITLSTDCLNGPALRRALEEKASDLNDLNRNPYLDPENSEWAADWHRVAHVKPLGQGRYDTVFEETPNQARRRMMDAPAGSNEAISFHSAIPMSAMHSRRAVAYDLAIGQACSIDDEVFYAYLCRVADWRLDWEDRDGTWGDSQDTITSNEPGEATLQCYEAESEANRKLIADTSLYRSNEIPPPGRPFQGGGFLPKITLNAGYPSLVARQSVKDRDEGCDLQCDPGMNL